MYIAYEEFVSASPLAKAAFLLASALGTYLGSKSYYYLNNGESSVNERIYTSIIGFSFSLALVASFSSSPVYSFTISYFIFFLVKRKMG